MRIPIEVVIMYVIYSCSCTSKQFLTVQSGSGTSFNLVVGLTRHLNNIIPKGFNNYSHFQLFSFLIILISNYKVLAMNYSSFA